MTIRVNEAIAMRPDSPHQSAPLGKAWVRSA